MPEGRRIAIKTVDEESAVWDSCVVCLSGRNSAGAAVDRWNELPAFSVVSRLRNLCSGAADRGGASPDRHWARDAFNVSEIQIHENFDSFDLDGSGFLDFDEMAALLKEIQGGVRPSEEEIRWVIKVADRDLNEKINKQELLVAVQAWHGYKCLPDEFQAMFDEFDADGDSYLDVSELANLLTKVTRHPVSLREANDVMEVADILSDGKLGKYELHGALGAWYVSVGREPTPAMSLAFIANNRTGGKMHALVDWAMVAMLVPTAYLPLAAAIGAGDDCKVDLQPLLIADGALWLILSVIVVMKGHWVQFMNLCCGHQTACRVVFAMSWVTLGMETMALTMLTLVEGMGAYYVSKETRLGSAEILACNTGAKMPVDVMVSIKKLEWRHYESYLEFASMWFTFNVLFNLVTIVAYYAYGGLRFYRTLQTEQELQAEASEK